MRLVNFFRTVHIFPILNDISNYYFMNFWTNIDLYFLHQKLIYVQLWDILGILCNMFYLYSYFLTLFRLNFFLHSSRFYWKEKFPFVKKKYFFHQPFLTFQHNGNFIFLYFQFLVPYTIYTYTYTYCIPK